MRNAKANRAEAKAQKSALEVLARGRHEDGRREMFRDMLACFSAYNIRVIGSTTTGAILVENAVHPYGDVFFVYDNGGEVNVARVNDPMGPRSMPYTAWGKILDGATVAYRVRCAMDDDAVDYDYVAPHEHLLAPS